MKFYEDIKFVYEIQSRVRDWTEQQQEEDRNAEAKRPVEDRRVPAATQDPTVSALRCGRERLRSPSWKFSQSRRSAKIRR